MLALPARPGRHDPLRSGDGVPVTVLHAYSPHVVPRPADWPATAHVTGYWTLPSGPDLGAPAPLAEFLDAPEPVVYLGFGSMPGPDPQRLADAVMAAARQAGVRVLVCSASPELRRLLPAGRFLVIRHAPHGWLFPRVQAIVHHGGAGTTGAAVAAGRPQVIWPFGVDQPFWARRMADLGVAAPARPVRALTGRTLAAALGRVLGDEQMRARAAELGRRRPRGGRLRPGRRPPGGDHRGRPAGGLRMIELPLPERVERRVIQTARRPVPVLCGRPSPDADTGSTW